MKKFSTDDIRVLSLIECILVRPKMYTPNGTPEEVMLLFQGISLGLMSDHSNVGLIKSNLKKLNQEYKVSHDYWVDAKRILESVRNEGHETNEEIFGRLLQILEK